MCEFCNDSIRHNCRCPNYTSPKTYHTCNFCKDEIQIGEEYIEAPNGDYAHLECCSLSGLLDTIKFLDIEIKRMEN